MPTPAVKESLATSSLVENKNYRIVLYERFLTFLSQHLNTVHGENHDHRYWEIIVGPWLFFFIAMTHYRFTLQRSKQLTPQSEPLKINFVPYDKVSFHHLFDKTNYMDQIDAMLRGDDIFQTKIPLQFIKFDPIQWGRNKKILRRIVSVITRWLSPHVGSVTVSPYISVRSQLKLFWISRFRILPLFLQYDNQPIKSSQHRLRTWTIPDHLIGKGDDFSKILFKILLRQIPYVYLEGYPEIRRRVGRPLPRLKTLFSATGWTQDDIFQIFASGVMEKGTKLIGHQHGGLYGIGASWFSEHDERVTDTFLTWGWKGSEKTLPFPSLKLSEVVEKFNQCRAKVASKEKRDALYVTTAGSRFWPDGFGVPSGEQFVDYLNWQVLFLKALVRPALQETVVRVYPGDEFYGWNQRSRIESQGIQVRFNHSEPYVKALSKAKLMISDNNFTTVLESYACNVPTVLFFNRMLWPIHERAQPIFLKMEEIGLFHQTPESAARHINEIYNNPRAWWDEPRVRMVRDQFQQLFVKTSRHFLEDLTKFLLSKTPAERKWN